MAERHRLGNLQVRESGHDRTRVRLGQIEQSAHQACHQRADGVDFVAQVQADIGCHLIVARTAGMQPFADISNDLDEAGLDVHVDVFEGDRPLQFAGLDLLAYLREPGHDGTGFVARQHTDMAEHARMGDGALNVVVV
jgi:hypothetical protein